MKMKLSYEKNIEVLSSGTPGEIQIVVKYMDDVKKHIVLYFDGVEAAAFIAALTEARKTK